MSKPLRIGVVVAALFLCLFLFRNENSTGPGQNQYQGSDSPADLPAPQEPPNLKPVPPGEKFDKWVVVTSINEPTETMLKLASLGDWRIVVVGDRKSPPTYNLENCVFLTVEDQMALGYRIINHLPLNHYTRKNIGYLYAIHHGATVIYETDDDNLLVVDTIPVLPEVQTLPHIVSSLSGAVNPYPYFGQETMWPRGFPLEDVKASLGKAGVAFNLTNPQPCKASIQQGLASNDPDVDAVFRLTRNLGVNFTTKPAVAIPRGKLAPFNSQNTLFHYRAFWALLIPVTTNFRVCDIWRGYWAQRLLWEVGARLIFTDASVVQYRNVHDLLDDFKDELPLYEDAGRLVTFLQNWKCSAQQTMQECIKSLTEGMVEEGFWLEGEVALTTAWLQDLEAVGYAFPDRV